MELDFARFRSIMVPMQRKRKRNKETSAKTNQITRIDSHMTSSPKIGRMASKKMGEQRSNAATYGLIRFTFLYKSPWNSLSPNRTKLKPSTPLTINMTELQYPKRRKPFLNIPSSGSFGIAPSSYTDPMQIIIRKKTPASNSNMATALHDFFYSAFKLLPIISHFGKVIL